MSQKSEVKSSQVVIENSVASFTAGSILPPGVIMPFAGASTPSGYLFCDGSEVSRTTYAALFAALGTAWGEGDGSTTFNLPDLRYKFLRGYGPHIEVTGTGSASSNDATFTAHSFTLGQRIRKTSGTLSGLSNNVDYYVIVVDADTIAFGSTRANALAGTKIAITGSNSAVISLWEDTDSGTRQVSNPGGNTGANVGSFQGDQFQAHDHEVLPHCSGSTAGSGNFLQGANNDQNYGSLQTGPLKTRSGNGAIRTGAETRPQNVYVNYIIKI
jgi:microcystin-dependent protein